jgi:hypothetical protein
MMAIPLGSSEPNPISEMSDSDYEKLVQNVHRSILINDGITTIDVLQNVKIKGKSGHYHQIDVYWRFKIGNVDYQTAIECKKYSSNITVGRVKDFKATLDDIGNVNGIMVTTNGYQKGAALFANQYDIKLAVLRSVSDTDLDNTVQIIVVNINAISRSITDVTINSDMHFVPEDKRVAASNTRIIVDVEDEDGIRDKDGNIIKSWKKVFDGINDHNANATDAGFNSEQTLTIEMDEIYYNNKQLGLIRIKSIVIKYRTNLIKSQVVVKNPFPPHYIMKTVNRDGEIFHIHDDGTSLRVK